MKKLFKKMQMLCLLVALGLVSSNSYAAYTIIAPQATTPEVTVANPGAAPDWMNDAVFNNSYGTVYAEAWDETGGNGLYVEVHDNTAGHTFTIHLGQPLVNNGAAVTHPDVVLGGDATTNYMAVVYTATKAGVSNVFMEVYTIINVNAAGFGHTQCSGNGYIVQLGNSGKVGNAHIDLANEMYGAGYPKADVFAVAWEDNISACQPFVGNAGARACTGSLSQVATSCGSPSITMAPGCLNNPTGLNIGGGHQVDIAVHGDPTNGYEAVFTYQDWTNTGNLYIGNWTGSVLTQGGVFVNSADEIAWPRIDMYDSPLGTPSARFDIVYRWLDPANNIWNIQSISNLNYPTPDEVTSYYNIVGACTYNNDNSKPVVTAGTEDLSNNKAQFYSLAYQNTGLDEVMVQNVDVNTGNLYETNPGDPDYRIVNNNTGVADPVAISNSYIWNNTYSQMQPDEIFVCWYNSTSGGSIDCKTTNSAPPAFKQGPNGTAVINTVPDIERKNKHVIVSPVPASDILYINRNGRQATAYSIIDVMGRVLMKGEITKDIQDVNITALAGGIYMINVSYADARNIDGLKIVKY